MKRMEGVFRQKSICLTVILCLVLQMMSFGIVGAVYGTSGNFTVNAIVDAQYRELYVFGNIPTGAEKFVSIYVKDSSNNDVFVSQATSYSGGVYSKVFTIPANKEYGVYTVKVGAEGLAPVSTTFNYQATTNAQKITGAASDNTVLMKTATEVNTVKNTMSVKILNGTVRSGVLLNGIDFEIGLLNNNVISTKFVNSSTLNVKAVGNSSSNTIDFTIIGNLPVAVTTDTKIGVILKVSSVMNAQTRSDVIGGINLMEYNNASKLYIEVDSQDSNISMSRPLQVDSNNKTFTIQLKYNRKPKVSLTSSDFTVTGLPAGMVLAASGDPTSGKVVFTTGSYNPTVAVTSPVTLSVTLKKSVDTNTTADSNTVPVSIVPASINSGSTGGGSSVSIPDRPTPTPIPTVAPTATPEVIVTPAPTASPSPVPTPSDINNHWAKAEVLWGVNNKIVNGFPDGAFKPDANVTRGQFVKLLVGVLKLEVVDYQNIYSDVSSSDWYAGYLQVASTAGIISSSGSFRPNEYLTREEMTVMMIKAYSLKKTDTIEGASLELFDDKDQISSWAVDSVQKAVKLGLMNGLTITEFAPKANATRAQSIVILKRMLDKLK